MKHPVAFVLSVLAVACSPAYADVRLPRLFADHMVLQQETANTFWGWATPGETVTVSASWGTQVTARAGAEGKWKAFLDTPAHGTGHTITIAGENQLTINDVAIGEVWLCAGQSNMGWSVGNSFGAADESQVNLPHFRIFKSQREHWHQPLEESRDRLQHWKPCDARSAAETSAVSYYFGKTLHQHLGVPVGIIVQAYAGTPIEGWLPWDIQQADPRAVAHKQLLDTNARRRIARGETVQAALATHQAELAAYNTKIDAGEIMKNKWRVLQPPFITKPASLGHQYPAHIYNAMIHPIRPYGIRGMIWYQGERNSKNAPQAQHYRHQLKQLIRYYRKSWHADSGGNVSGRFPFQFTQLPSWNPPQDLPVEGLSAPWAVNREAMRHVEKDLAGTGMVVTIDTGDTIALHPKNKRPIGIRHALLALQQTYQHEIVGRGPTLTGHTIQGSSVVLAFDSVGSGLATARPGPLDAFAIAGSDHAWHQAKATIQGNTVHVSSPRVKQPVAVRYAWAMNPSQRNLLYNREGLPASPFRTDDWPLFQPAAPLVDVHKPDKPAGYQPADWKRPPMPQARAPGSSHSRVSPSTRPPQADHLQLTQLASKLGTATMNADYETIADYTWPGVVKQLGGRKAMIAETRRIFTQMKKDGIHFAKYDVGKPGAAHQRGKYTFVVVPLTMELRIPSGKLRGDGYLLAISPDKGTTWTFADGSGLADEQLRNKLLPPLPMSLKLPAKTMPQVIRDPQ